MSGKLYRPKKEIASTVSKFYSPIRLIKLGEWGGNKAGIRTVRLISRGSLLLKQVAQALRSTFPYAEEFRAGLIVTPGGFGEAEAEPHYDEARHTKSLKSFMNKLLRVLPDERHCDIILGLDTDDARLQEGYYISTNARSSLECMRIWKSYPRTGEEYVITKGRPCPNRTIRLDKSNITILICHDLAAFSRRSERTRKNINRKEWAKQLSNEIDFGSDTGVIHLIHYLDNPYQGNVFKNAMDNLIYKGAAWGISTFKTALNPISDLQELELIERWTARFAGPTLDLYVAVE